MTRSIASIVGPVAFIAIGLPFWLFPALVVGSLVWAALDPNLTITLVYAERWLVAMVISSAIAGSFWYGAYRWWKQG